MGTTIPTRASTAVRSSTTTSCSSVNSWKEPVEFVLPAVGGHRSWVTEIDSGEPSDTAHRGDKAIDAGARILIPDFSLLVLRANDQPSGPPSTTTISIPLT